MLETYFLWTKYHPWPIVLCVAILPLVLHIPMMMGFLDGKNGKPKHRIVRRAYLVSIVIYVFFLMTTISIGLYFESSPLYRDALLLCLPMVWFPAIGLGGIVVAEAW